MSTGSSASNESLAIRVGNISSNSYGLGSIAITDIGNLGGTGRVQNSDIVVGSINNVAYSVDSKALVKVG